MIDREKVIKGLECCVRMNSRLDERYCDDCPYNYQSDGTCTSLTPLLDDVLALLKVQEKIINEYIEKTGYLPKAWYAEVLFRMENMSMKNYSRKSQVIWGMIHGRSNDSQYL